MNPSRPTVPQLLPLVLAYKGSALHVVLDDGNMANEVIDCAYAEAMRSGDGAGAHLAAALRQMTYTQRRKLYNLKWKQNHEQSTPQPKQRGRTPDIGKGSPFASLNPGKQDLSLQFWEVRTPHAYFLEVQSVCAAAKSLYGMDGKTIPIFAAIQLDNALQWLAKAKNTFDTFQHHER